MKFKKKTFFFGLSCSRDFVASDCHPSTLIDFANTALASKCSTKTLRMISERYRNHGGVTGPMKFKKNTFFFEKSCSRAFGARACHPSIFIDLANSALASKGSVETKCMIAEVYRTHGVVNGPMNFKKSGRFFFPECHGPGSLGNLAAILAL